MLATLAGQTLSADAHVDVETLARQVRVPPDVARGRDSAHATPVPAPAGRRPDT